MIDKISKEQYEELCQSEVFDGREEFNKMLAQITGITAKPYVSYSYYDGAGNYVGDSDRNILIDLLKNAYIEIGDT